MNTKNIFEAKDPFLKESFLALQEAAKLAREVAIRTNTGIVILQDGEVVTVSAEELRAQEKVEGL